MSRILGIKLHVSALYICHRQVVLKLMKEVQKMHVGCPDGKEISSYNRGWQGVGHMERCQYKYSSPSFTNSNMFMNQINL